MTYSVPKLKIYLESLILVNTSLVYHILIPLLNSPEYSLIKFILVPIAQKLLNVDFLFTYIQQDNKYIAINTLNETYISFTLHSLSQYKSMNGIYNIHMQ